MMAIFDKMTAQQGSEMKASVFLLNTIVVCAISILNSVFYTNWLIMSIVVGLEVLFLFSQLLFNRPLEYLRFYIAFMALSLESPNFIGTDIFYGFKSFRILGVNLGVLMIFPLLIRLFYDGKIIFARKSRLSQFVKHTTIIICLGLIIGLLHWLINDNSALKIAGLSDFLEYCYIHVYVLAVLLCIYKIILSGRFEYEELEDTLFSIIIAIAVTMLFSLITHNYGNRGGLESLQVSNLYMVLPCAILIAFYGNINKGKKIIVLASSIVALLLSMLFNANGKIILSLFLSFAILLVVLFKQHRNAFYLSIIATPLALFALYGFLLKIGQGHFLLYIKIQQGIQMISFWRPGWFETLGGSPKFRFEELITIVAEYVQKPWDLLLGKGYMGSVTDHFGYFSTATTSTFPEFERVNHFYVGMHETLNSLFLTNGLLGIWYFIKYTIASIRVSQYSFWAVIGGFWFVMFFSYSVTIAVFGITAMAIAFYKYDVNQALF